MKYLTPIGVAVAAALLQACTTPPTVASDGVALQREETFIPFANQRSAVYSWQADGREGIWVEGGRGDWYHAKFFSPCVGIDTTIQIGFDNGNSDKLDRYSHVLVPGERVPCAIQSFTKSDPPPDGKRQSFQPDSK